MKLPKWLFAPLALLLWTLPASASDQIIIRTTLGLEGLQQLCVLQNCSVGPSLGDPLNELFLVTTPLDATTFLNLIRPLPGIVSAELDQLISLVGGLNIVPTPLPVGLMSDRSPVSSCGATGSVWNSYANQPAATIVHVQDAQKQFCGAGVVADIDTGVDPNHPAFAGVLLPGYDFTRNQPGASELNDLSPSDFPTYPPPACSSSSCPSAAIVNQSSAAILDQSSAAILDQNVKYAAFGHGTMVMGVIHLVAPKASLLPLKVFHSDGTGYLSDILRAIYYAVQNHANVINMSFDFTTNSPELSSALDYANQSTLVSVSSAGNDGKKEIVYPAALQTAVMGVASTSDLDTRSSFSNFGNAIVWVAAPGEAIVTTYPFGTYAAGWGTSFSAPFVSGTSSLLLSKQAKTNEAQAAAAIAHAVPLGSDMGNGRLDIVQALQALVPDFLLSSTPTSTTISAGQSATYTVTVSPVSGLSQSVALTCNGFPASSTCVITPPTLALDGTHSATAIVVVQTTARASLMFRSTKTNRGASPLGVRNLLWFSCFVATLLLSMTCNRFPRIPRLRPTLATGVGILAVSLTLNSCGGSGSGSSSPPPPASNPTLSSLVLNPATVVGGSSSTATVALSAAAPSGNATVALSSSNQAVATVPTNVTVAAGATGATFSVSTSAVTTATSVNVSASYSGVTKSASISVMPPPPSGTPAGTYTLTITGTAGTLSHTTNVSLVVN